MYKAKVMDNNNVIKKLDAIYGVLYLGQDLIRVKKNSGAELTLKDIKEVKNYIIERLETINEKGE